MKKMFLLLCSFSVTLFSFGQDTARTLALIPEPVSLTKKDGSFTLPQQITVAAPSGTDVTPVTTYLKDHLEKPTGGSVTVGNSANAAIKLVLNKTAEATLGAEGYRLSVTPQGITITANKAAGLFYGVQTMLQLFPKELESATAVSGIKWEAPAVEITDYPRFGWRGLMLDVARHFFTKEDVKQYIDDMVRYKFNLLHLHLTDDEGWRIEIKSLPNLTKVGAWNVKKTGYFGTFEKPGSDEPRNYGGFYTQDDIKELVQYAKAHFVNILPEIDVPGHSLAAIASYPELACTPGGDKYGVSSGQEIKDWSKHEALVDDNLCPANENVYQFLDKVLTEVAQLFPFEYIHMGGDETFKTFWEKSDAIKALMKREKLKSMDEVQSYFERRVEKIVTSKGKRFMGWDEILEGGVSPTAAVMSWRGIKGGITASQAKHEVVMSPSTFAYIDYMQADPVIEPRIYDALRLNKTYQFEPAPEGADPKYIKGGQANLWSEQIYNLRTAQYMTWPRGMAIAESVWSPKEKKNWTSFVGRVESQFERLDAREVKYAKALYDPMFTVTRNADSSFKITLDKEVEDLDLYYTIDNSFPDRFSTKYTEPITVPSEAAMLRVISYRGKTPMGRLNTMTIEEMKKRAPKKGV
ncbi:MAG TPA: family 20 glycosylhydrolase [Chitinophagaceae bacterium]|nr:family 20 glycosylhydrolase [Chitinophagaceae bacterium]